MIPAVSQTDAPVSETAQAEGGQSASLLIRLGADGRPAIRGQTLDRRALNAVLQDRLAQDSGLQVIVLPTGSSRMQALVSLMDQITQAGVTRMRVVRLEAAQ